MAPDRDDEPGVLGNLPRSRPGRRSDKRATTARAKQTTPPKKRTTASSGTARKPAPRAQAQRPRPAPAARKGSTDPVGQAVELAGKVAAIGVRTAAGIVKRLPRP